MGKDLSGGGDQPATSARIITPSDTLDTEFIQTRAIYVGGGGNLRVQMIDDQDVLFTAVPTGQVLALRVKRVFSTNTTATLIVGLW